MQINHNLHFSFYNKPTLFLSSGGENREAVEIVQKSKLPIQIKNSSNSNNPKILDGFAEYAGLEKIKQFIQMMNDEKKEQVA